MNLCLHLGFHKTGTSFLQKKVFPFHPDIEYWGKEWKIKGINDVALRHIFNSEISIDTGKVTALKDNKFLKDINSIINLNKYKLNIFSEERFSSSFYYKNSTLEEGIERISKTFNAENNDLKILLVVRNQSDFFLSRYSENKNLFSEINRKWNLFKNFKSSLKKKENLTLDESLFLDNLKYYSFIKILEKKFNPKKIGIFFYEDLLKDPDQFFCNIFKFLNIRSIPVSKDKIYTSKILFGFYESKKNKFYSGRITNLLNREYFNKLPKFIKILIKFVYSTFLSYPNFIIQSILNSIKYDNEFGLLIKKYYKDNNEKLGKYLNRDLKKIGY